jgi:ribosomal protein S18 acetylase RimI-like enzyme
MEIQTHVNDAFSAPDLDDPIGASLRTAHASLAEQNGSAIRYRPDVSPFCSIGAQPTADGWDSLRTLTGASGGALFMAPGFQAPEKWRTVRRIALTQMVHDGSRPEHSPTSIQLRDLDRGDVPEMLRLTAMTEPGPFSESTVEFGGYVGIFDGSALVAMAGRRMNPPSFIEVSAVCTDPGYRGRGFASAVMSRVLSGIREENSRAFLHVAHGNPARKLYEDLGFVARREFDVLVVEPVDHSLSRAAPGTS